MEVSSKALKGLKALEISAPFHNNVDPKDEKQTQTSNPVYLPRLDLSRTLLNTNLVVVATLEKAIQITDLDAVSSALVNFFRSQGSALSLLKFFLKKEINETVEAATLFRGVSLTTKMISSFCMLEGQRYCKSILDPLMRMFCIDEVSIEVDPAKLQPGEDISTNQEKLLGVCKGLLNHIIRSVDNCSLPLRRMLAYTRKQVNKKFPEHNLRVVGGFYFLRFLCPALVCPEGFGLTTPSPKSRRSLILVSKAIQNLANDVEFGEKESYMVKVNPFIKNNQSVMWKFLVDLASPPKSKTRVHTSIPLSDDPLMPIYKQLVACRVKVQKLMIANGHAELYEQLTKALDVYGKGEVDLLRGGPFLLAASRLLAAGVGIGGRQLEAELLSPTSPPGTPTIAPTSPVLVQPAPIPSEFRSENSLIPSSPPNKGAIAPNESLFELPIASTKSKAPSTPESTTTTSPPPSAPLSPAITPSSSSTPPPSSPRTPLSSNTPPPPILPPPLPTSSNQSPNSNTQISTPASNTIQASKPVRLSINMKEVEFDLKQKMAEIQTVKAKLINNEYKDLEEKRAMQTQFQELLAHLKQATDMLKTLKATSLLP